MFKLNLSNDQMLYNGKEIVCQEMTGTYRSFDVANDVESFNVNASIEETIDNVTSEEPSQQTGAFDWLTNWFKRFQNKRKGLGRENLTDEFSRRQTNQAGQQLRTYSTQKSAAQGVLTTAQFAMNAGQLKNVLDIGVNYPYFYFLVIMIALSMTMQIMCGFFLAKVVVQENQFTSQSPNEITEAAKKNNYGVVMLSFLIGTLNIVISAFYVSHPFK